YLLRAAPREPGNNRAVLLIWWSTYLLRQALAFQGPNADRWHHAYCPLMKTPDSTHRRDVVVVPLSFHKWKRFGPDHLVSLAKKVAVSKSLLFFLTKAIFTAHSGQHNFAMRIRTVSPNDLTTWSFTFRLLPA